MFGKKLTLFLLTFILFWQLNAQETSPTPQISEREKKLNQLITELQKQKEIAELERDIAKAQKDSFDAEPKATATPLKSDVVITGEEIEPDIIVYGEMNALMERIGESIKKSAPNGSTIAVFDSSGIADWKFYRQSFPMFKLVIEDLTNSYCQFAKPKENIVTESTKVPNLAIDLAKGANLVGQAADILSYLRTETKVVGKNVNVLESSMVAQLFGNLRGRQDLTLFYPKTFAPETSLFCGTRQNVKPCCQNSESSDCQETKNAFCSETANLFDRLYRSRRLALESNATAKEIGRLNKEFEDFNELFIDKNNAMAKSALEKYLNAELFVQLQQKPNVYFLQLQSLRAVGKQRLRKNLFFLSDKIDYSGGIIVEWSLFDKDGRIVNSGLETSYDGYKNPKNLKTKRQNQ